MHYSERCLYLACLDLVSTKNVEKQDSTKSLTILLCFRAEDLKSFIRTGADFAQLEVELKVKYD